MGLVDLPCAIPLAAADSLPADPNTVTGAFSIFATIEGLAGLVVSRGGPLAWGVRVIIAGSLLLTISSIRFTSPVASPFFSIPLITDQTGANNLAKKTTGIASTTLPPVRALLLASFSAAVIGPSLGNLPGITYIPYTFCLACLTF